MADTKKTQNQKITTHKVRFDFPRLTGEADFKYKKVEGEWYVTFYLDKTNEQDRALLATLKKAFQTELAKEKAALVAAGKPKVADAIVECLPYTEMLEGPHEGKYKVKASQKFKVTPTAGKNAGKTFEIRPELYDNVGDKMAQTVEIWSGTEGKVRMEVYGFRNAKNEFVLVKRLVAVQIINLRTRGQGGGSAADHGFGVEEGNANEFGSAPAGSTEGSDDEFSPVAAESAADQAPADPPALDASGDDDFDF